VRVLVTGGNGFIGTYCVDALAAEGLEVHVYDLFERRLGALPERAGFTQGDLADQDRLRGALEGADAVLHLAWSGIHESSTRDPAGDVAANLLPSLRLVDACAELGVRRLVFLSSGGAVYGSGAPAMGEEHPTDPISAYGISKLAVEKYLHLYRVQHGLEYVVLRPSVPYGPGQDAQRRQGVVSVFLHRIARGQPVEIWGDGSAIRDYFYVADLARATVAAVTRAPEGPRVFNLGGGRGYSLHQLLEILEEVTGRTPGVEYREPRKIDPPRVSLDISRAERHLGWRPVVDLREGVERTWEWIRRVTEGA